MISCIFIIFAAVLVIGIVAWTTVDKERQERITLTAGLIALTGGLILYGYCFWKQGEGAMAVIHTLLSVCWIFIGENGTEAAVSVPVGGSTAVTAFLLYVVHTLGIFTTISAVLSALAGTFLKKVRVRFIGSGELILIYGVNTDSMIFAQELMEDKNNRDLSIVFVDEKPDMDSVSLLDDFGGILRTDREAFRPTATFLRSIGMLGFRLGSSRRKMHVYALDQDMDRNLLYATDLMHICEAAGVESSRISLTILGLDTAYGQQLQGLGDKYGYHSVELFDEPSLVSRVLIRDYPPYRCMTFDENGLAVDSFTCVLVGFGQVGQNILRSLIRNGQFHGSHFKATVFDKKMKDLSGAFEASYPMLTKVYDIDLVAADGRSREFYDYLDLHAGEIKYVAVCTGNETINALVAENTFRFLRDRKSKASVLQCSYKGIRLTGQMPKKKKPPTVYSPDVLHSDKLDQRAMYLNCFYNRGTPDQARDFWKECKPFDRESSRASADFIGALLFMAHAPGERAVADGTFHWATRGVPEDQALAENLARTEHLRWMAFHYTMGYRPMTQEEYRARAAVYLQEIREGREHTLRISKDNDLRIHAALIPWEKLPALSAVENKAAADRENPVDFQDNDYTAIYSVPVILRGEMSGEEAED